MDFLFLIILLELIANSLNHQLWSTDVEATKVHLLVLTLKQMVYHGRIYMSKKGIFLMGFTIYILHKEPIRILFVELFNLRGKHGRLRSPIAIDKKNLTSGSLQGYLDDT